MAMKMVGRALAVTKFPRKKTPLFIAMARLILQRMTGNSYFPAPSPPLVDVSAAIEALAEAEAKTLTRVSVAFPERDARRKKLERLLEHLKAHVQACADADPDNAQSIIESAGMSVKKVRPYPASVFRVKQGPVSGSVVLLAPRAAGRAGYEWGYRVAGTTAWTTVPYTVKATTTIRGLTVGAKTEFRYRTTTKNGAGDWSDPVPFIVA